jgi:hypothetical protein
VWNRWLINLFSSIFATFVGFYMLETHHGSHKCQHYVCMISFYHPRVSVSQLHYCGDYWVMSWSVSLSSFIDLWQFGLYLRVGDASWVTQLWAVCLYDTIPWSPCLVETTDPLWCISVHISMSQSVTLRRTTSFLFVYRVNWYWS